MIYWQRWLYISVFSIIILMNWHVVRNTKKVKQRVPEGYLTISGNEGRLGNQIWPLMAGYGISKVLNRQLYIRKNSLTTTKYFKIITAIFPAFKKEFQMQMPEEETLMNLASDNVYRDPVKYLERKDQFLHINLASAQHVKWFFDVKKETDLFLEFDREIVESGEKIVRERKLLDNKVVCAHIRRTDFVTLNISRTFGDISSVTEFIVKKWNLPTVLLFGDDRYFLRRIMSKLRSCMNISSNSLISRYSEAEDLYLAKRICDGFVLTSESSTFGFWLAYLIKNQQNVYYLKDWKTFDRGYDLLPWRVVNMNNGTVRELGD